MITFLFDMTDRTLHMHTHMQHDEHGVLSDWRVS